MKYGYQGLARPGAIVAFFIFGLAWSLHARADDELKTVLAAAPAQEPTVRLPALRAGGIRRGNVLMISDRGTEIVKVTVVAQRQVARLSPFSDFCLPH